MNKEPIIHLKNIASLSTLSPALQKDGRNLEPKDIDLRRNQSIISSKDQIIYIGDNEEVINSFSSQIDKTVDMSAYSITPEIVDSHTHLIFGGDRSDEYIQRLNGESYEIIAKKGGGINATSFATNNTSIESLIETAKKRIQTIHSYGVGTIEIKSGYGLNLEKEVQITKAIHQLKKIFEPKIKIVNTFMAAHAIPKGFKDSNDYLKKVCLPALEELAAEKIIDYVDIFHENGYFSEKDVLELAQHAKNLKVPLRSHADEFYDNKGAALAAENEFHSADHLLSISEESILKLSKSKTVATLLPGTGYFLGKPQAPARRLLDAGCKVAIASDYNPGSCHWDNVLAIANLSAPNYKINQAELWCSITLNAAHSLNLRDQGAIQKGLKPRFSFFNTKNINQITYAWSTNYSLRIPEVDQFFYGNH